MSPLLVQNIPMMTRRCIAFALLFCLCALPAHAGTAEARDVARANNCTPKKIEVFQNSLGTVGKTVYQVTCNLPKSSNADKDAPDALLIACQESICSLLRPVSAAKK
jgi:hypothetical protein